jgi:hypothetical protein
MPNVQLSSVYVYKWLTHQFYESPSSVPVCCNHLRRISTHSPSPLGITGLATAIALRKLPNVDIQIYERATELRELGQVIALNPNGLRTLEKLGLHNVLSAELGYRCPSGIPQTLRCGFRMLP